MEDPLKSLPVVPVDVPPEVTSAERPRGCRVFFRLGFMLCSLGALWLLATTTWRTTPPGVVPEMRVALWRSSWAWALDLLGDRYAASGQREQAVQAWRLALSEDPGRANTCRRLVTALASEELPPGYGVVAKRYSMWLLRLRPSNQGDLELVASTLAHFGFDDVILGFLEASEVPRSPSLDEAHLRALFLEGRVREFRQTFERTGPSVVSRPEIQLLHVAYLAGWGEPIEAVENLRLLEQSKSDPETGLLAHRLSLLVSRERVDVDAYRQSLVRLMDADADRVADHVWYWRILAALGRRAEAVQRATESMMPPTSGRDTVLLADTFMDLGLGDLALQILRSYADDFAHDELAWLFRARELAARRDWDQLVNLGGLIRYAVTHPEGESLIAYSYFLEGWAATRLGLLEDAQTAFEKLTIHARGLGHKGLFVAARLFALGFDDAAQAVLKAVEPFSGDTAVHWQLTYEIGARNRSSTDLLQATKNLLRLKPNDLKRRNQYVAVLNSVRRRPVETYELSFRALTQDEWNPRARLNHSHVLLLVDEVDEAAKLLNSVNPNVLDGRLQQSYDLALLEIEMRQGRWRAALNVAERIRSEDLLPGDADRLAEFLFRLRGWERAGLIQEPIGEPLP